jgi:hypothetical protein
MANIIQINNAELSSIRFNLSPFTKDYRELCSLNAK